MVADISLHGYTSDMKKTLISLSDDSVKMLEHYKTKGINGSALINMALLRFDDNSIKVPSKDTPEQIEPPEIKKVKEFLYETAKPKHFMSQADKVWLENYRMAKSKGGTLGDVGWIEFDQIPVPSWYTNLIQSGEIDPV